MIFSVLFDANVFYPAPLRDLLIELAYTGLFKAWWTKEIDEEWLRNLLKNRPDLSEAKLRNTISMMHQAVPDCLVTDYQDLIPSLTLPDKNDRHVLAAAIKSHSQVIVTHNLKDFPPSSLQKYNIEALSPDDFLMHQIDLHKSAVIVSLRSCRKRLKNPPKTIEEYLQTLEAQGLIKFVAEAREFGHIL
ncbi:putative toxin-antitoxin system toxin component, PIN family [Marinibactrum halimedae]|uniref:PIN domain-containing protein n=1 Tax=Marinibactrum halimedae TaxID=1444977 RepID=A0AA37T3Q3_9GAMM|nr:PIN domain-containing protein [Marinibactrum halimedae]MCD9458480.1 PIN domain-containing protein [Marinibactrum halimedae]GLS26175.1 hypothetical protein GCM10007877_18900 [Marinibactrum halimedae]